MVPEDGTQQAAAAAVEPSAVSEVDSFWRQVDDLASKTDVLEKRVNEVVGFYDGKKHGSGGRRASGSSRYAANGAMDSNCKGMPDLMRELTGIIHQITSHEWSAPFLQPVDVVGLQLDDYHKKLRLVLEGKKDCLAGGKGVMPEATKGVVISMARMVQAQL